MMTQLTEVDIFDDPVAHFQNGTDLLENLFDDALVGPDETIEDAHTLYAAVIRELTEFEIALKTRVNP